MKPSIQTLGQILYSPSQYVIPVFQRNYRWEEKEWSKLWESLEAIQEPDKRGNHFMGFLAKEFPHMVDRYNRLYAGAYAAADYVSAVRGVIDLLQKRYDVRRRASRLPPQAEEPGPSAQTPEQPGFSWRDG